MSNGSLLPMLVGGAWVQGYSPAPASLAAATEMSFNVPRWSRSWHLQNIALVSSALAAGRDFNLRCLLLGNNHSVLAVRLSPRFFTFVIFSYCDDHMTNNETTSTASYLDPTLQD